MEPLLWLVAPFVITAVVAWWLVRRNRPTTGIERQEIRRKQLQRIEAVLGRHSEDTTAGTAESAGEGSGGVR